MTASNDLDIESGAAISAAGAVVSIGNQSSAASAGLITATAGGNLTLGRNATLDVSGAGSADAGSISLAAVGSASVGANLDGRGGVGAAGGSFSLDARSLTAPTGSNANPLTLLAGELGGATGSGGFTDAIDLRVRTGDVTLAGASTLSANSVTLTADTGKVLIDGQISAPSGALRGNLSIFGGDGVELGSGGALHADGIGPSGVGGTIEIGAGQLVGTLDAYNNASIVLDANSTISAAGAAGMGTLLLRAPALTASNPAGDDVAIQVAPGTSLGAITSAKGASTIGEVIVEPVMVFNTSNTAMFSSAAAPSSNDFLNVGGAVESYMATAASNISTRLASAGGVPLAVEAGSRSSRRDPVRSPVRHSICRRIHRHPE